MTMNEVYRPPPPAGYSAFKAPLPPANRLEIYFDNPFGTAFKMTVGILAALTLWSVLWFMLWISALSVMIGNS